MRLVLKHRRRRREHDIGEQNVLGVKPHRAVYRRDQRHLDVEDVHEHFFAFAIDLVITLRTEEVEGLGADRIHKGVSAAGQDDDAVFRIGADRVKEINELLVGMPVEDQLAAIGVKRHFQNAGLRTGQPGIGEALAITLKSAHEACSSQLWLRWQEYEFDVNRVVGVKDYRLFRAGMRGWVDGGNARRRHRPPVKEHEHGSASGDGNVRGGNRFRVFLRCSAPPRRWTAGRIQIGGAT